MAINRFDKQQELPRFNPLSFQELAFAPITLRNREDANMNQRDEILNEMNNIQVFDQYQDEVDAERQAITTELGNLADKIQKEGAGNMNYQNDFRNLKLKYNKAVSNSGNIGRAAELNKSVNAYKDMYFTDALKKGHNAEDVTRNWNEEMNLYRQGLPSKLGEHKGQLPEMNPNYAPNTVNLADKVKEYGSMMSGVTGLEDGSFNLIATRDPNTGAATGFQVVNKLTNKVENNAQIASLTNLLKRDLLDPDSDLSRNLAYRGIDPKKYFADVDDFATLLRKVQDSTKYSTQFTDGNIPKGATASTRTLKQEKTPDSASLNRVGSGKLLAEVGNVNDIDSELKAVENDTEMDPYDKARRINMLNTAKIIKEKVQSTPEFSKKVNESIANDEQLKGWNITSYDEFLKRTSPEGVANMQSQILTDYLTGRSGDLVAQVELRTGVQKKESIQPLTGFYNKNGKIVTDEPELQSVISIDGTHLKDDEATRKVIKARIAKGLLNTDPNSIPPEYIIKLGSFNNQLEGIKEKVEGEGGYASSIMSPLLEKSNMYSFSPDTASTKVREALQTNLKNIPLDHAINDQIISIKDSKGNYVNSNAVNDGELGTELMKKLNTAKPGDLTYEAKTIYDGGLTGDPSIMFNIYDKEGGKHEVALELKKGSDTTRDILDPQGEYYENLDPEGKAVINSIRDKVYYGGIATDIEKGEKMFDTDGTQNIKSHAVSDLNSFVSDKNYLSTAVSPLYEYLFVNPKSNKDYSMVINKDEAGDQISYSMYAKEDGEVREFTFADYVQKEAAVNYINDGRITKGLKSKEEMASDATWKAVSSFTKAQTLYEIATNYKNLDDLSAPENALVTMFSHDPRFLQALKDANKLIINNKDTTSNNVELYDGLERIFNTQIANLPVRSKSRKILL